AELEAAEEGGAVGGRGQRVSVLSEEAGLVDMGAPFPRVLLDPVDGSRNAKRGIPVVGMMLALADGPTLAETRLGFALNIVSGERWHAIRGGGFFRQGQGIAPARHSRPTWRRTRPRSAQLTATSTRAPWWHSRADESASLTVVRCASSFVLGAGVLAGVAVTDPALQRAAGLAALAAAVVGLLYSVS